MSTALWIKIGNRLAPADAVTETLIQGIKQGEYIRTSAPRRPRNPKHHKLMMAILQIVVDHCWPRFADIDALLWWLKHRSGRVKTIHVVDSQTYFEMESISFDAMDQTRFKALADQWLEIICKELMPGTNPEELLREAA